MERKKAGRGITPHFNVLQEMKVEKSLTSIEVEDIVKGKKRSRQCDEIESLFVTLILEPLKKIKVEIVENNDPDTMSDENDV